MIPVWILPKQSDKQHLHMPDQHLHLYLWPDLAILQRVIPRWFGDSSARWPQRSGAALLAHCPGRGTIGHALRAWPWRVAGVLDAHPVREGNVEPIKNMSYIQYGSRQAGQRRNMTPRIAMVRQVQGRWLTAMSKTGSEYHN